jgi:ribosomal-protein-alanine N-acetyltransferase
MQFGEASSQGFSLRTFRLEDLETVMKINMTTLPENYTREFYLDLYRGFPEGFILAEVEGRVVGYVMCRLEWGLDVLKLRAVRRGHIVSIAVLEGYRRRGIGEALMLKALEAMKARQCEEAFLEVRVSNGPAISLYRKLGFEISRRLPAYYRDGEDAYEMVKPLRA